MRGEMEATNRGAVGPYLMTLRLRAELKITERRERGEVGGRWREETESWGGGGYLEIKKGFVKDR